MQGTHPQRSCRLLCIAMLLSVFSLVSGRAIPQPTANLLHALPIGTQAQSEALIKRLKVVSKTSLSSQEQARLTQTVSEILTIYTTHDFDAFKRFMMVRKGSPNPQWIRSIRTVPMVRDRDKLPAAARTLVSHLPSWPAVSDWDTLHVWWEGRYAEGGVWRGVDPTNAFLQVYEREAEPEEAEACALAPAAFSHPSAGLMFQINHFFPPATARAKYAAVYLTAQPQGNDPVFPRLFWLRWDKAANNWILDRAAQPYAGERSSHCDLIF
jgi:hypothetical protein